MAAKARNTSWSWSRRSCTSSPTGGGCRPPRSLHCHPRGPPARL